jgi:hypothetical protein
MDDKWYFYITSTTDTEERFSVHIARAALFHDCCVLDVVVMPGSGAEIVSITWEPSRAGPSEEEAKKEAVGISRSSLEVDLDAVPEDE